MLLVPQLMICIVFEERLKPFYDQFGFNRMLCG